MIAGQAWWIVVAVGAVLGVFVGLVGTSGAIMIPAMVYVFGLTQLRAQGTSLFIALLPIWIAPLWSYARAGNVDWRLGGMLALGIAWAACWAAAWRSTCRRCCCAEALQCCCSLWPCVCFCSADLA